MILFGYRAWAKVLATLTLVCTRCGNPSAHHVVKRQRWFTLFFIPVIPLYITRSTQCTYCGQQSKISKADADALIGHAGVPGPVQQAPQVPQQQFAPAPQQQWAPPQAYPQAPQQQPPYGQQLPQQQ